MVGIGIVLYLILYIFIMEATMLPPKDAILLVKENKFYPPPCVMDHGYDNKEQIILFAGQNNFSVLRWDDITDSYDRYPGCAELVVRKKAFYHDLEEWGILPKSKGKWNHDGTWNY